MSERRASSATAKIVWREFRSQTALRDAVRFIVDPLPFHVRFISSLVSDLIAERHYFCRWRALRPEQFKKTPENSPYRFYGLFAHVGWHPVSWSACLAPPPTREDLIARALRNRTQAAKTAFRRAHPICMHCQKVPAVETHHAEPSFKDIIARTFAAVTSQDLETALERWNWFHEAEFELPAAHAILDVFDPLHLDARLESLCKGCHARTKRA